MNKKNICFFLCLLLPLSCTACQNREEPKNIAVVNSVIYDIKEDGQYKITAEVMNPSAAGGTQQSASDGKSPSITVSGEGSSIREAISDLAVSLERSYFGGHNKVRFFTERLAKEDMTAVLDFLLRDHLTDETSMMVVIQGPSPQDIHFSAIGLSELAGDYIESLTRSQPEHMAKSVFVTTLDFVKGYYEEGKQPVTGVAMIDTCGEKPSENTATDSEAGGNGSDDGTKIIMYEGLAAFKDGKLVGYMDGPEARSYNLLTTNIDTAIVSIPTDKNPTVLEIGSSKADIRTTLDGDIVSVDIQIKIVMRVVTAGGDLDVSKSGPQKTLEQSFNQKMQKEVTAAIHKAQRQFHSDIFGFGSHVHTQHPRQWQEMKDNWDEIFSGAQIHVTVESSINREGEIKQPFTMEDVGQ